MIAKALASFLALLALATPVAAQAPTVPEIKTGPGTRYFAGPPPARFIREGLYALMLVDPAKLYEACGAERVPKMELKGCMRRTRDGFPVIIMPLNADPFNWFVLIHEAGHAAGWPGDHPL